MTPTSTSTNAPNSESNTWNVSMGDDLGGSLSMTSNCDEISRSIPDVMVLSRQACVAEAQPRRLSAASSTPALQAVEIPRSVSPLGTVPQLPQVHSTNRYCLPPAVEQRHSLAAPVRERNMHTAGSATDIQLQHGREESPHRRRVVVVPVNPAAQPLSPELGARMSSSTPSVPVACHAVPASSSYDAVAPLPMQPRGDDMSLAERERYLQEIQALRRENGTLLEEVVDTREQALRHLRSNAERMLQRHGADAEGPCVAPSSVCHATVQRSSSPVLAVLSRMRAAPTPHLGSVRAPSPNNMR